MDYTRQYNKYKNLYFKEKGARVVGAYREIGKEDRRLVLKTDDNMYVSYVTKSIDNYANKITKNPLKPKHKILVIDTIDTFDQFTNKYGRLGYNRKYIFIQWARVANDFKGFYLDKNNTNLALRRKQELPYGPLQHHSLKSWWAQEYSGINGVMVFKNK